VTARDRLVVAVIVAVGILVAGYLTIVSPERGKASRLGRQLSSAQASITTAQNSLQAAQAAQTAYPSNYSTLVRLGKAVPPQDQVASLIYQLDQAAGSKHVFFASLANDTTATAASTSSAAPSFTALPFTFTFTFDGNYFQLYKFLRAIDGWTTAKSNGGLVVDGRLLTVQGVTLAPSAGSLAATITATAYTLPSGDLLPGDSASTDAPTTLTSTSTSSPSTAATPATVAP
jgi:Tfp pilus assembly protein PilO